MIKYFALVLTFLGLFLISFSVNQNISVNMKVPEKVRAGENFQVTLIINKGNLQSFSRFQQDLPYGLTAERVSSANADFSFEDQRVRFIWLKLPADEQISVTYNIAVQERLKGSFKLEGEFSYIEENDRENIRVTTEKDIVIIPNPALADSLLVDIKDYLKETPPQVQLQKALSAFRVERKAPRQLSSQEFLVEMVVTKGDLSHYGKIEEFIPAGFTTAEDDSNNGIFSFDKQILKIIWLNLPKENQFTISYKLIQDKNLSASNLKLSGKFSFTDGTQTKNINIREENYDLAALTNTVIKDSQIPDNQAPIKTTKKDTSGEINLLQPENGIYYRVQLAAGHSNINVNDYFRRLNLDRNVKLEYHEGWRKYTVGSFHAYLDAYNYLTNLLNRTSWKGAFVAAYNNGERISVQEALMITKEKW